MLECLERPFRLLTNDPPLGVRVVWNYLVLTAFDKQILMILIWFADLASTVLCFPTCHDSTLKTPKAMAARMAMS